jgi:hypothetical protein
MYFSKLKYNIINVEYIEYINKNINCDYIEKITRELEKFDLNIITDVDARSIYIGDTYMEQETKNIINRL